jgi:hypothetical protein
MLRRIHGKRHVRERGETMRKPIVAMAASAMLVAGVLAGSVAANNPDAGEVIASGFKCTIIDGTGHQFIIRNSTLTLYQNKVVLRCTADGAPAPQLTYWTNASWPAPYGGGICVERQYGPTTNWQDKVGYNGNSQLVCTKSLPSASDYDTEDAGVSSG